MLPLWLYKMHMITSDAVRSQLVECSTQSIVQMLCLLCSWINTNIILSFEAVDITNDASCRVSKFGSSLIERKRLERDAKIKIM